MSAYRLVTSGVGAAAALTRDILSDAVDLAVGAVRTVFGRYVPSCSPLDISEERRAEWAGMVEGADRWTWAEWAEDCGTDWWTADDDPAVAR